MNLNTKISTLNRVGKTTAIRLKKLGISNVNDLLLYFPFRYEDYSQIKPINSLQASELVSIQGIIELINNKRSYHKKKILTEALVSDPSGSIRVIWFGQPFITKNLKVGDRVSLSGKVTADIIGLQFVSPIYEKIYKQKNSTHTARLIPIYPTTANVTQKQIRYLISEVINVIETIPDKIDEKILKEEKILSYSQTIKGLHYPNDWDHLEQCWYRMKFEELFNLQLKATFSRMKRKKDKAFKVTINEKSIRSFVKKIPFTLTKSQKISSWQILQDMEKEIPMNRMLSGDVGSGKTVVAALAIKNCLDNSLQTALMAPTEILAVQHYNSLKKYFNNKTTICLLTQGQALINNKEIKQNSKIAQKREVLDIIAKGKANIVIGTHALLSDKVKFKKLGLVIVDEQHRFGVDQRMTIKQKSKNTHFLSMTATPIPRSLALIVYGDLDLSTITEMPPGRKPVLTRLVKKENRQKAYEFIQKQIDKGKQIFVVCPLIEENDTNIEKKSVVKEYEKLSKEIFPNARIGFLHGKLKSEVKEKTMKDFQKGDIDILVSTSVIEVGIDIPNASLMMIEGSERFGLAQLHQFRGRVGRSEHQSYCILFTQELPPKAKLRLEFFEINNDGFKLAEKDLMMRGPGEVYGKQQSGIMNLRFARLSDHALIKKIKDLTDLIISNPKEYPLTVKKLENWSNNAHLE